MKKRPAQKMAALQKAAMESLQAGSFRPRVVGQCGSAEIPKSAGREEELAAWFSDAAVLQSLRSFPPGMFRSLADRGAGAPFQNAVAAAAYLLLVYHVYPNHAALRNAIDSQPKLARNFEFMKTFLESTGGREAAETLLSALPDEGYKKTRGG